MARSSFSLNPKKGPSLSVAFQASQIKKVSMYGLSGDNKLNSGIHDFDSFLNIPNPNKREQILIGGEGTKQMKANQIAVPPLLNLQYCNTRLVNGRGPWKTSMHTFVW